MATVEVDTVGSTHHVLEEKLTSLRLYCTAQEAYDLWRADPERTKVLDVRTFEEYVLIGHAEMATNIPLAFPSYKWNAGKGNYSVVINANFIAHVSEHFKAADAILVMCRSGGRSAKAVNALAAAGFTNVYNIVDGFEGDKVEDPESIYHGKRMKNGWRNSAPWTYELDPSLVWMPSDAELGTLLPPLTSEGGELARTSGECALSI